MATELPSVDSIFFTAMDKPSAAERAAYLDEICGKHTELRRRVERLLSAQSKVANFLESPADLPSPAWGRGAGCEGGGASIDEPEFTEVPGTVIGPYKLLEQIGEGGFGVVFMAEQTHPVRRKVALKVLKPGMDTRQVVARFEAERQALAIMDHPNIAKVFDGGTTGEPGVSARGGTPPAYAGGSPGSPGSPGRPYFVMELVKGIPIIDFCDQDHLNVRERLELFCSVCQAVQHAHQKGIIHRDLKPSNVMVTMHDAVPVVKVIDFGIAKATGQQLTEKTLFTNFAQMLGTPMYMSPEQAQMSGLDIDTRSDIYSLGVLLYELLTGTTPFDKERLHTAAFDEIRRIIREEEPARPSMRMTTLGPAASTASANRQSDPTRLRQLLRGELDWIVMKCLEKDRDRRYETANGLAMDVRRYLCDEPVLACPPSAAYRLRKFARRNKLALAASALISAALVLAVVVLAVSNLWVTREKNEKVQALRDREAALANETTARAKETAALNQAKSNGEVADQQRQLAELNLKQALAAVDRMLMRVGQDRLRDIPLMEQVRRELLEDAFEFYNGFLAQSANDPEIRLLEAVARGRLGIILSELGQYVEAERSLGDAITSLEQLRSASPPDAEARLALATFRTGLGSTLWQLGRRNEAIQHHRLALTQLQELDAEFPETSLYQRRVAAGCTTLAACFIELQPGEAEDLFRRAIELAGSHSDAFIELASAEHNLTYLFIRARRWSEAEGQLAKALHGYQRLLDENPTVPQYRSGVAGSLALLGTIFQELRRPTEAEQAYRGALAMYQSLAADFPTIPVHRVNQAGCHAALGRLLRASDAAQAADNFRQALATYEKLVADFPQVREYRSGLPETYVDTTRLLAAIGRVQEAQQAMGQGIALQESLQEQASSKLDYWWGLAASHIELGRVLAESGRHGEADREFQSALEITERLEADFDSKPDFRADLADTQRRIACGLTAAGRIGDALAPCRLAIQHYEKLLGDFPEVTSYQQYLAGCHSLCGRSLASLGRTREAEAAYRKAIDAGGDNCSLFANLAAAQLALGDMNGYRKSCAHMLARFDQNEAWTDANSVAWFCVLSPESGVDFSRVVAIAEQALTRKPPQGAGSYRRDALNTLGIALFRAGRHLEAIARLGESIEAHSKGGDPWDWLFLAMVHWKLDNQDEARQWYDRSVQWLDENRQRLEKQNPTTAELRRFRAEAEQLLGMKSSQ